MMLLFTLHAAFVLIPRPSKKNKGGLSGALAEKGRWQYWETESQPFDCRFQGFLAGAAFIDELFLRVAEKTKFPACQPHISMSLRIAEEGSLCDCMTDEQFAPRRGIFGGKMRINEYRNRDTVSCNCALIGAGVNRFQWPSRLAWLGII